MPLRITPELDYVLRMEAERHDLADKVTKLAAFLERPDFADKVDAAQAALMRRQLSHMESYLGVLGARLERCPPTA